MADTMNNFKNLGMLRIGFGPHNLIEPVSLRVATEISLNIILILSAKLLMVNFFKVNTDRTQTSYSGVYKFRTPIKLNYYTNAVNTAIVHEY